ncbi:hypothetical protein PFBG_05498 [Plasmodium falciparum 7G8]|uniref:EF-hand domain-containing protein n=1 Tax=Plasmodium falciparum (isolate 7G8) TaxID=57266 RepID=W7EU71_PLAF8|nr:hypothetical protein PFBG_05498 [Plasmodium falciparum 7G8]
MNEKPYIPIIEKLNNEKNPNFYICGNGYIAPLDIKNLKKISNTEKKNLQRVFSMMDKDNTGKISVCNLHDILHRYNYKISKTWYFMTLYDNKKNDKFLRKILISLDLFMYMS